MFHEYYIHFMSTILQYLHVVSRLPFMHHEYWHLKATESVRSIGIEDDLAGDSAISTGVHIHGLRYTLLGVINANADKVSKQCKLSHYFSMT